MFSNHTPILIVMPLKNGVVIKIVARKTNCSFKRHLGKNNKFAQIREVHSDFI
jgi:hypothetical protein